MKILLTGVTGYIGKRLLPMLVEKGHEVYCVVRDVKRLTLNDHLKEKVKVLQADLLNADDMEKLPVDIEAAYYLVHSMNADAINFANLETMAAKNFASYIKRTSASQIIYLSGISNSENLSKHLASRKKTEDLLRESNKPLTVLRAAIIIGEGSASFEIIRDLVEKLPVMITPKWLNTRCQPISIINVIEYLTGILLNEKTYNKTFDIGGSEILSYKRMLLEFARIRGYKRMIITLPVLTPRLSSYWLYFVTSTSFELAKALVDSMKNEVICADNAIHEIVKINLLSYESSIRSAFLKMEQNMVVSSWKDAVVTPEMNTSLSGYIEAPKYGCFTDKQVVYFTKDPREVLRNVWSIGGERGWYFANWLWLIRGGIDKLAGGVGLRRGRRNAREVNPGDALDFWRVILADKSSGRLLLYAEMKLPGEAWLELKVGKKDSNCCLEQTATFRPRGVYGRLYWYMLFPVHFLIFKRMAANIVNFNKEDEKDLNHN